MEEGTRNSWKVLGVSTFYNLISSKSFLHFLSSKYIDVSSICVQTPALMFIDFDQVRRYI